MLVIYFTQEKSILQRAVVVRHTFCLQVTLYLAYFLVSHSVTLDDMISENHVLNFLLELDNATVIYERYIKLSLYAQL